MCLVSLHRINNIFILASVSIIILWSPGRFYSVFGICSIVLTHRAYCCKIGATIPVPSVHLTIIGIVCTDVSSLNGNRKKAAGACQ